MSLSRPLTISALLLASTFAVMAQKGSSGADWRYISGDAGGTKYSPLDQIDASNVSKLKIAWRWKSLNYGPRPDYLRVSARCLPRRRPDEHLTSTVAGSRRNRKLGVEAN